MSRTFLFLLLFLTVPSLTNAARFYVDASAGPGGEGAAWATAFQNLQDALDQTEAGRGDEVWIAAGTYYPDDGANVTEGDRTASFHLKESVTVYGGFAGVEADISERDWTTNRSILSGKIYEEQIYWSLHVCHATNATIDGIEVIGGNANGTEANGNSGAIVVSGDIVVRNCVFSENSAGFNGVGRGTWTVTDSTFTNNSATNSAGVGRGTWTVTGCVFTNNSASNGGVTNHSDWTVTDSTFTGNSATYNGGVAYYGTWTVSDSIFISNSAGSQGGVVFRNNWISVSDGTFGTWTVTNCTFDGNSAAYYAGVAQDSEWTVTGSSFTDNSSSAGGVAGYSDWTVTGSTFTGNSVSGDGGVARRSNWTVTGSTFTGNSANQHGGVVFEGVWTVTDSAFAANSASGNGGVAQSSGWTVTSSTFTGNSAESGGVVHSSNWTVTDSTFTGNSASKSGGVLYQGDWRVTNSSFEANSAILGGGVVSVGDWDATDCTFTGNSAGGGGVASSSSWTVTDCTFADNSASTGGVGSWGSWTVSNSTFRGNSADSHAGVAHRAHWTVTNCAFENNAAGGEGGVAYHSSWTVTNCTFDGNSATHGGVTSNLGPYPNTYTWGVVNSTFTNNAADFGGVARDGAWTVTNATFAGNSATNEGGMAYGGYWTFYNNIVADANSFSGLDSFSNAQPTEFPTPNPPRAKNIIVGGADGLPPDANIGSSDWTIDADPLFVDRENPAGPDGAWGTHDDGLRLQATSPAIDQGNADVLPPDTHDLDHDGITDEALPIDRARFARIQDDALDLGAYEFGDEMAGSTMSLHVTAGTGGTSDPSGLNYYPFGASVTITATPSPGYIFEEWTGDLASTDNPHTFTLTTDTTVAANFGQDTADDDGDGLSNYDEIVVYGTGPNNPDTSGDGIYDGEAVAAGLDPITSYTDIVQIVIANSERFGLYTESSIMDLSLGGLMLQSIDGGFDVEFLLETSENLSTWQTIEIFNRFIQPEGDKAFLRVRADPPH